MAKFVMHIIILWVYCYYKNWKFTMIEKYHL